MQLLTFILPYSNWPGPVNTNWGLGTKKYKLRAEAAKYKLGMELSHRNWDRGQGLDPGTRTRARDLEIELPKNSSPIETCWLNSMVDTKMAKIKKPTYVTDF